MEQPRHVHVLLSFQAPAGQLRVQLPYDKKKPTLHAEQLPKMHKLQPMGQPLMLVQPLTKLVINTGSVEYEG